MYNNAKNILIFQQKYIQKSLGLLSLICMKKFEKALEYYQKAVEIDPNDGIYINNFGVCMCDNEQYQECLSYLRIVILIIGLVMH